MYYVYILKLRDGSYYVGYSENLKSRIKTHNLGQVHTTKNLIPVELIFYCSFTTKIKALNFEKYLKAGSGVAFRNKRLV